VFDVAMLLAWSVGPRAGVEGLCVLSRDLAVGTNSLDEGLSRAASPDERGVGDGDCLSPSLQRGETRLKRWGGDDER
jgi:hypothetical protein